jgi:hypothetical protein
MVPMAHIAGVPVEETLGMFGPVAAAMAAAGGASIRIRLRRLRDVRRRGAKRSHGQARRR